jgi:hypothetical protein
VHALRPADICALTLEDAEPAAGSLVSVAAHGRWTG